MSKFSIEFDLNETEEKALRLAVSLEEHELLTFLKEQIVSKSQEIVINYAYKKKSEEDNGDKEIRNKFDEKDICDELENVYRKSDEMSDEENDEIEFSYKYANKEWMKRALNALVEAKKQNVYLTTNDIFRLAGISDGAKKNLRTFLGRFLRKSGVKCRKYNQNGTTVTDYYI